MDVVLDVCRYGDSKGAGDLQALTLVSCSSMAKETDPDRSSRPMVGRCVPDGDKSMEISPVEIKKNPGRSRGPDLSPIIETRKKTGLFNWAAETKFQRTKAIPN